MYMEYKAHDSPPCEHDNEPLCSVKVAEFLDHLTIISFLKRALVYGVSME